MKATLLSLLLFTGFSSFAQTLTVSPNSASKGQSLSILFSGSNLNFAQGTNTTYMYFAQGTSTLYPNQTFSIDSNHTIGDFTINPYTNCGSYTAIIFGQGSSTLSFPNALTIDCSTNISGTVYNDLDSSGTNNAEPGMPYTPIIVQPGNITGYADYYGNYSMPLAAGTYQVSVAPPAYYAQTSTPSIYTINTTVNPVSTGVDFGLHAPPVNDVSVYIQGPHPRVGYSRVYWLYIGNNGTTVQSPNVTLTLDSNLSIASCQYPYTANGNTYTIDLTGTSIYPNNYEYISLEIMASASAPLNQTATIAAQLTNALQPDNYPADNVDTLYTYFVNSFDPNEKTVIPAGVGTNKETLKSSTLKYQIDFQNTGNDVAYLVQIVDTLDANLDLRTFKLLGSSHPVTYSMKANGVVTFRFQNINLPASSVDQKGSQGNVSYSIKPKSGIAENTVISNTASIFFDFNQAVVTNTTRSTMVTTYTGINDISLQNSFLFYPNPASDALHISNEKLTIKDVTVYNMLGEVILTKQVNAVSTQISTSTLTSGVYLVRMQTQNGEVTKRISIVH